ncbi:adenylate cyclase type 10 [Sphaerodactylus townsendi]|uniref:adenylate cyclase type 10 n=1 Tax=Sphaerodactylus townsendi TaxID=933632 RepID=UPI0020264F6F|nr:adenylate cyclase type 10 [Sphaerodactylus townsendi]
MTNPSIPQAARNTISILGKVAAHVPDLIVYGDFSQNVPSIETFDGVLLFIDISGFTALTEKYSTNTNLANGADQLTQTLNRYVGEIVEEVMVFGGDILNFAGDAMLALWKANRQHINDIIFLVLKCSLRIQQEYGVRDTEVGLELRVKIGISAGHVTKVVVGNNRQQYFLVIGRAVDEVRLAQNLAKAGEIILSPNGWELCHRNLIEIQKIPNERAVKVKYLKISPQEFDEEKFFNRCVEHLADNHICDGSEILRRASVLAPNVELEKSLRKFITRNILKKIDDDQPLEYLSELRPVTMVFVNLQFDETADTFHLSKAVQDANLYLTEIFRPFRGKINKVFMFDKGCTFLCLFGLPGDKQANESAHALDCAHKIHNFCSASLMKVKLVSVGVTSGPVFCGVVGHRLRHEYTVIGRKVNLAARIMVYYPGVVTCDAVTYSESKLPHYFFQEVPSTQMKGILDPGTIYKFLGITEKMAMFKAYLTKERSELYPLLGRKKETDIFEDLVENFKHSRQSHILMYEGHLGYGKSQLLCEIAYLGQTAGHKVVAIELTKINLSQNFFTIRTLMAMFLGIDVCKSYDARQHVLLNRIRGVIHDSDFCLLNSLFYVKFPASEVISNMDAQMRNAQLEKILVKILKKASEKEIIIFVIDDAHFIDSTSWDFLHMLLDCVPIFLVISLSPFEQRRQLLCSTAAQLLANTTNTYCRLKELTPAVVVQKACQDLGVVSIARELETFLIQRSHGNPFFCEELLHNLHLSKVLQYHILEDYEETEDGWDNLFTSALLKSQGSRSDEDGESDQYICTIKQNVKLHNIMLPPTLKGIALAELDNISPSEQMVVKCAAIIGVTFSTELLLHILPEWTKVKMNQTLATLVELNIFECFSERKTQETTTKWDIFSRDLYNFSFIASASKTDLSEIIASQIRREEAVMHCKHMNFCTPLLKETAYELWLNSQKRALHLKCASYLESDAHQCKYCGERNFIAFHRSAVDELLGKIDEREVIDEPEDTLSEVASQLVCTTLSIIGPDDNGTLSAAFTSEELSESKVPDTIPKSSEEQSFNIISKRPLWMQSSSASMVTSLFKKTDFPMQTSRKGTVATLDYTRTQLNVQEMFRTEDAERAFLVRLDEIIRVLDSGKDNVNNLGSCYCEEIVESVIVPLSQHCMALDNYVRSFYYLLECAAAYVNLSNNYMAFTYLNTAESLLKSLHPKQKIISQFEISVLYSLKGEVSYNMGQIHLAKKMERKALALLNRSFPLTTIGAFFMSMVETSKHLAHLKKQTSWQLANGRDKKLAHLFQQGRCLSVLWQAFSLDPAANSKKFSRLAALMTVNCAEESQDEAQIISSYMEFSLCCQLIGWHQEWMKYEEMAIKRSSHLRIVGGELFILAKVAASLAYMKLCLGNLALACQLGFRAHEICELTQKSKLNCSVLFDLFSALFLRARLAESAEVLSWLEKLSFQDDNIIGKACFISGCMDLMLYASVSYKPFAYCLDFIISNSANCILLSQNAIMLSLYSSIAIWYARLNLWEDFKEPFEQARRMARRTSTSLSANYGFCKFVECQTLLFQTCIGWRTDRVRELRNKIAKNLEQALEQCSTSPVYYPRVFHLKAYVQLMLGNDEQSGMFLDMATQSCYENYLERSWLIISQMWWFTGKTAMEDEWVKTAPDFPVWKEGMSNEELKVYEGCRYLLKMPELDIDQSFKDINSQDLLV